MQTAFRTNHLEGRETAALTDKMEKLIKLFDRVGMSQKTFNELADVASKSKRNYLMDTVYYLQQRLSQDTLFADSIKAGAEIMSEEIQEKLDKKNQFGNVINDVKKAIPKPADLKKGADKLFAGLKGASKKRT